MLPVVTVIGSRVGMLVTGAVLVETVFAWPGLGQLLLSSLLARDYPVLLGMFLLVSLAVILATSSPISRMPGSIPAFATSEAPARASAAPSGRRLAARPRSRPRRARGVVLTLGCFAVAGLADVHRADRPLRLGRAAAVSRRRARIRWAPTISVAICSPASRTARGRRCSWRSA